MNDRREAPLEVERVGGPDGVEVVRVGGDLVLTGRERLEEAVEAALAAEPRRVVVDLSRATHVDMPGFALLVRLDEACREAGSELVVAALPIRFRETSEALCLPDYLRMTDDVEAATGPGA